MKRLFIVAHRNTILQETEKKLEISLRDLLVYRIIHKSLRDFRPLQYSSRDGHAEWEHVNRKERHSKFLSCLTGARYVNSWWRGRCQSCNQVPFTHVQRVWQELDYKIDMLPFDVTILATVPQRSEIPEGLMNYPVYEEISSK